MIKGFMNENAALLHFLGLGRAAGPGLQGATPGPHARAVAVQRGGRGRSARRRWAFRLATYPDNCHGSPHPYATSGPPCPGLAGRPHVLHPRGHRGHKARSPGCACCARCARCAAASHAAPTPHGPQGPSLAWVPLMLPEFRVPVMGPWASVHACGASLDMPCRPSSGAVGRLQGIL